MVGRRCKAMVPRASVARSSWRCLARRPATGWTRLPRASWSWEERLPPRPPYPPSFASARCARRTARWCTRDQRSRQALSACQSMASMRRRAGACGGVRQLESSHTHRARGAWVGMERRGMSVARQLECRGGTLWADHFPYMDRPPSLYGPTTFARCSPFAEL